MQINDKLRKTQRHSQGRPPRGPPGSHSISAIRARTQNVQTVTANYLALPQPNNDLLGRYWTFNIAVLIQ